VGGRSGDASGATGVRAVLRGGMNMAACLAELR
jgi:hypothetical protein